MTRFQTDFNSSVWCFCRLCIDIPPGIMSLAVRNEERQLFLHAMPRGGRGGKAYFTCCVSKTLESPLAHGVSTIFVANCRSCQQI